jgi:hypothetical protein
MHGSDECQKTYLITHLAGHGDSRDKDTLTSGDQAVCPRIVKELLFHSPTFSRERLFYNFSVYNFSGYKIASADTRLFSQAYFFKRMRCPYNFSRNVSCL